MKEKQFNLFLNTNLNDNNNVYDFQLYDIIVIEYLKEYTNEEYYFSFDFNQEKNLFDVSFIDSNKKYSMDDNELFNDYSFDKVINIYETILSYANSNFLFNNSNNNYIEYDISFYEFKKLFFTLPYLNDLLWKNCYKITSKKTNNNQANLISYKSLSNLNILYDKVTINLMKNERKIVQFIFVSNMQQNSNFNHNNNFSHDYNSIIINYNVYSNCIIKKLYDIINNKIQYQDLKKYSRSDNDIEENAQLIKDSLSDFKNLLFYTTNNNIRSYNLSIYSYLDKNNKHNFLNPLLPLYINFNISELKNNSLNFNIDISYSFWKLNNAIITNKGYAKFPINNNNEFYQWRKCLIRIDGYMNIGKIYKIKFDCFNNLNKNEKKMQKLNICKLENNEGNDVNMSLKDKEKNGDNADDIIMYKGEKYIGLNILINRNNNYNCL